MIEQRQKYRQIFVLRWLIFADPVTKLYIASCVIMITVDKKALAVWQLL